MSNRIEMPPVTVWGRQPLIEMPPVTVIGRARPGMRPADQAWMGYTGRQASDRARRDLLDHGPPAPPAMPGRPAGDWPPPVAGGIRGPNRSRPQRPPSPPAIRQPYRPPVLRPGPPRPSPLPYPVDRFPVWTGARPGPAAYRPPPYLVRQPPIGPITGAVGARAAQLLGPGAMLAGLAVGTFASEAARRERRRESARLADIDPGAVFSGATGIRAAPGPAPTAPPTRSRPTSAPQRGWFDRLMDWLTGG